MGDASCDPTRAPMTDVDGRPYEYGPHSVGPMPGPPLRPGSGRISAYVSALLGTLSLLAVFCFRFPQYLTTPELRDVYDVDTLRLQALHQGINSPHIANLLSIQSGKNPV